MSSALPGDQTCSTGRGLGYIRLSDTIANQLRPGRYEDSPVLVVGDVDSHLFVNAAFAYGSTPPGVAVMSRRMSSLVSAVVRSLPIASHLASWADSIAVKEKHLRFPWKCVGLADTGDLEFDSR